MAVVALIQFTQGDNTDSAGKAVLGTVGDFSPVTVSNGDNTGVASWAIYLLDAPQDSTTFPPGAQPQILAQAADGTPTVVFTPDVSGTYRVMLEVTDGSSHDRDIRCFAIPDGRSFVRPPYQQNPDPLPIALPVIIAEDPRPVKPDEQNYRDNVRGWAGNGDVGQLDDFLRRYDDLPSQVITSTPYNALVTDPPLQLIDLPTIDGPATFNLPDAPRPGFVVRVGALGASSEVVTIVPAGGGSIGTGPDLSLPADAAIVLVHRGGNTWDALVTSNGRIAPGSYVGQPVLWDGSKYAPGTTLIAGFVQNIPGFSMSLISDKALGLRSQDEGIHIDAGQELVLTSPTDISLQTSGTIETSAGALQLGCITLGFYDQAPIERPTIAGETTQGQVNSLVAALVALGLVVDGR